MTPVRPGVYKHVLYAQIIKLICRIPCSFVIIKFSVWLQIANSIFDVSKLVHPEIGVILLRQSFYHIKCVSLQENGIFK